MDSNNTNYNNNNNNGNCNNNTLIKEINNLKFNNDNKTEINNTEELLLNNKEILQSLILENMNRKERDYICYKDLDLMLNFEKNLVKLIEICPKEVIEQINKELNADENK